MLSPSKQVLYLIYILFIFIIADFYDDFSAQLMAK